MFVDGGTKGLPPGAPSIPVEAIGRQGWNVLREDLPLPLAVIRESALAHNSRWMRRFLEGAGAVLCPHGKTTMSPELFRRQMADGAWGITVSTAAHLRVCRDAGLPRVLVANQIVGRTATRYLVEQLADPSFELFCLVDSIAGVRLLAEAVGEARAPRPLQVLIEVGYAGGRTGCRSREQVRAVGAAIRAADPRLALRGVEGFEGSVADPADPDAGVRVGAFLDSIVSAAADCERDGYFAPGPVILSAGGSAFFDLVVDRLGRATLEHEPTIVIRSGCYLTHDAVMYTNAFARLRQRSGQAAQLGDGLRPAIEVWAYVQSRPEPRKVILSAGRRDCSTDAGLPVPLAWFRPGTHRTPEPGLRGDMTAVNDQHLHMSVPADSPLAVGDMVVLGISHPCTTFDKWRVIPIVNDAYDVVDAVRTCF